MKRHKFHFIINKNSKDKLFKIKELNKYTCSGKINFILSKLYNIINSIEILKINEKSEINYIENKKHFQLYLNKSFYRFIKKYHFKFNTFSLAQFIRMAIKIFIELVEKYGFDMALELIEKQTKKLKKINKIGSKKYKMVQLLNYLGLKQNKNLKIDKVLIKLLL